MAEGPLVHHYARMLRRLLLNKKVRIEFGIKKIKTLEPAFKSVIITRVEAHGKQFRIYLNEGTILMVHLLMWGSWRVFKRGQEWDKPRHRARVIIHTSSHDVVAFSAPVVKILKKGDLEKDTQWGNLGPDPLRPDFSFTEFSQRLRMASDREIGEALLDQQIIAGIGNILRIEILFHAHVHPRRKVKSITKDEKDEIIRWTFKLMQAWMSHGSKNKLWQQVYRKAGQPCPVCDTSIEFFRQAGRITYACPTCQKFGD